MPKSTPIYVGCKPCRTCNRVKSLGEFSRVGMGLRAVCDACREREALADRTCITCGETKSIEAFTASGILRRVCFDPCFLADRRDRWWADPRRHGRERTKSRRKVVDGNKWCTKCDTYKLLDEFPSKTSGCGHGSWCKACVAAHNRKQYERPEVQADRLARRKQWGEANPGYEAEWRSKNPERAREKGRAAAARRRARLQGLPVEPYTVTELVERDGTACVLCGEELDWDAVHPESLAPTVEHLEPIAWGPGRSAGDVPSNCAMAHFTCNCQRGDRPHPAATRKRAELLAAEQEKLLT